MFYPRYKWRGMVISGLGAAGIMAAAAGVTIGLSATHMLPVGIAGAVVCVWGILYQSLVPRRRRGTG